MTKSIGTRRAAGRRFRIRILSLLNCYATVDVGCMSAGAEADVSRERRDSLSTTGGYKAQYSIQDYGTQIESSLSLERESTYPVRGRGSACPPRCLLFRWAGHDPSPEGLQHPSSSIPSIPPADPRPDEPLANQKRETGNTATYATHVR